MQLWAVALTDGTMHKRDKALLVPHDTEETTVNLKNVIKVATKQHKDKQQFKRESIDQSNVIEGGRAARNRTPQDYSVLAAAVKREKKTKSP